MAADPHEHPNPAPPWRLFVDTGGTFTDCLGIAPDGSIRRAKVLSSGVLRASVERVAGPRRLTIAAPWLHDPGFILGAGLTCRGASATIASVDPADAPGAARVGLEHDLPGLHAGDTAEVSTGEEAPVLGARMITGAPAGRPLPPTHLRLATTRGTNALLERRGARTAFFVTEGFADLLLIGDQTRPDLFTLRVRRPAPLHDRVVEVRERLDKDGRTVTPLDLDGLRIRAREVLDAGIRVAAVALMHSWREPAHERAVRDLLRSMGFEHVSASSDLGSAIGFLARAETAVVNAYLAPVIDRYLDGVQRPMMRAGPASPRRRGGPSGPRSGLLIMTSAGGLVDRARFAPKDSLLSGPAGGVVGAAEAGRRAGFDRVITFDMGGTSTDCARCEGAPERVYQTRVGDARIVAPCVAVETVAAGGGSVCAVDRAELRVGPESAGAEPGPACYGRGGPLTVTDCNLLLGRLDPSHFAVPLDRGAAEARALEALAQARAASPISLEALLTGFLAIADQRMSEAVRRITIRRGHDPGEHALVAFGGAGPQHACAIADALGIDHIVIPPDAGLLSAFGLSVSGLERVEDEQVLAPLDTELPGLTARLDALDARARAALADHSGSLSATRTAELRYRGQDDILELDAAVPASLHSRFEERYREIFGYTPADTPLELVTARVTARVMPRVGDGGAAGVEPARMAGASAGDAPSDRPPGTRVFTDRWQEAPIHPRHALRSVEPITGPALLTEAYSTTYIAPGWRATLDGSGSIVLVRVVVQASDVGGETSENAEQGGLKARNPVRRRAEAVEVELAAGKLTAIAEEMGERLRRSAISTNVKQRRDFSCAILDAGGRLVVNAPHVPVHLGSMGVCVRALRDHLGPDLGHATIVTNHPAFGGSHLPDVTVVEPVHNAGGQLLGYAAARAHHAEIGGIAPGSMAPEAARLAEEGVVIPPTAIPSAVGGVSARALFTTGPHPSRDPETNIRDLAAAVHAVRAGADGLRTLADALGPEGFGAIGETIQRRAESRLRAALARLPDAEYRHTEPLAGGGPIAVCIRVAGDRAAIDFTGSGPVHPRCLNATPAIVTSAVVYVLRLLIDEDLPLNEGLLRAVDLIIPEGLLNPPFAADPAACAAVAGGNVEVSQLVVETMLTALGLTAQSQGTMNNTVFGNENYGFYETLGGGAGAGPGFPGESAIHTHMTNTVVTDSEILEYRFPVRLESTAIRRGSGGDGRWPGGDGMIRRYRFLEPAQVAVLSGRAGPPRGGSGGGEGKLGVARLHLPGQQTETLGPLTRPAPAGAVLEVESPGGGGFGETTERPQDTTPPAPACDNRTKTI